MAEENENKLFRQSALNRISSADELDIVLKVTNPSAWFGIGAFLALVIGLLVWSFVAEVPVTTTTKALVGDDGHATCWVDADLAEKLRHSDARVSIASKEATRVTVNERPMSSGEIKDLVGGGYLAEGLDLTEWNYQVDIEYSGRLYDADTEGPFLAPAEVVTEMEHPITLVFGA